jgi:serine phosphatase RsbU (regulator of sigma subunit)
MNSVLHQGLPSDVFVAAMVVAVAPDEGKITLANAGIPYPYLLRPGNGRIKQVTTTGLLLGIAEDNVFRPGEETDIDLKPGERMILYTDGLSEAIGTDGRHFEDELLPEMLSKCGERPCQEILSELIDAVEKFSSSDERDDITLFGIEIKQR